MATKHVVLGTAGHVDHGKTLLVKALTGIETDTLEEERRRGLTIDIGFAFLDLPGGGRVGLVDVPGHRRFVSNMLAGAAGIDGALLVVAADDSVMPQTREHLDILRLLGVAGGIVVVTKTDLVDADTLAIVREEIVDLVRGTFLEGAPVAPVSSVTGAGVDALREEIVRLAGRLPERAGGGALRLPIDRAFSIEGAGLVVTGTIFSGRVRPGDAVAILPAGTEARVRAVEVHGEKVGEALAGTRAALNLVTQRKELPSRGDAVCDASMWLPTSLLDVKLELIERKAKPLRSGTELTFHLATSDVVARVRVLSEGGGIAPGGSGCAQMFLAGPVVAARGDRFVVRQAGITIGGGTVADVHPRPHRGRKAEAAEAVAGLLNAPLERAVENELSKARSYVTVEELRALLSETSESLRAAVAALRGKDRARSFPLGAREAVIGSERREALRAAALEELGRTTDSGRGLVHARLTRAELAGTLSQRFGRELPGAMLDELLKELLSSRRAARIGETYTVASEAAKLPAKAGRVHAELARAYASAGFAMPDLEAVASAAGAAVKDVREMLAYMVERGELVELEPGVALLPSAVEEAKRRLAGFVREKGRITVSEFKGLLNTSRKYALPLIQLFDKAGFTRRDGDYRTLAGEGGPGSAQ